MYQILYKVAQCLPGLTFAIVLHEFAHAWMALKFGDDTAQRAGRLSLNPAVHYDPMGTIVMPLITVAIGWFPFGWARPVPINTRNFKNYNKAVFWVSFAGPLANFIFGTISAFLFALVFTKAGEVVGFGDFFSLKKDIILEILGYSVLINFIFGGFNLLPVHPLDGAKMCLAVLKGAALRHFETYLNYSNYIFLILLVLSMTRILPIFHYLLYPFQYVATTVQLLFISLLA